MFRFIYILIFFCGRGDAFEVRFYDSYPNYRLGSDLDAESSRLQKREMQQFFDKGFQFVCFVFLCKINNKNFIDNRFDCKLNLRISV